MDNSLNQATYERLKKDILSFELEPGDSVSAAKIADRYNVSRTPAREALVKLETEGLIDIFPQSKSLISKIDLDKAKQEWFIRRSIEIGMVEKVCRNITKKDLSEMKKHNKAMLSFSGMERSHENAYNYQMADNAFHAVTYRVSGEHLAATVISNTMAHYSRLRFLTDMDNFYQDRTVMDHEKLITLLENKDVEGYKDAVITHLGHIINDIEDLEKKYPDYFA